MRDMTFNIQHSLNYKNQMKTFVTLLEGIDQFGTGSTFAEHVENYLLVTGVTKAEIESIRSILLT